ncbi:MAG: acetate/propionate family kinase [Patescibacteria group bacterium]
MPKQYLVIFNAGSATLKFKLYDRGRIGQAVISGQVERIGLSHSFIRLNGKVTFRHASDHRDAIRIVLSYLEKYRKNVSVIGHRVVHGGTVFSKPAVITSAIMRQLESFSPLAPLHNPKNIAVIKECLKQFPGIRNVAVFDTGIFRTMPEEYSHYAIPLALARRLGIRKFGFHGISHGYAASQASGQLRKPLSRLNVLTIHLGNGCSIAVFKHGRAIDSSLGFTPTAGLVMGTRSGDLDPIIPLYLQKKLGVTPSRVENMLNNESGLLGLSGFSSDMREILRAAGHRVEGYIGRSMFTKQQRKKARLALAVFIARLRFYVSAYAGMVDRLDAIVFTGSMGERSQVIRQLTVSNLPNIRRIPVLVARTDEELAIAREVEHIV